MAKKPAMKPKPGKPGMMMPGMKGEKKKGC